MAGSPRKEATASSLAAAYGNVMARFATSTLRPAADQLGILGRLVPTAGPSGTLELCVDGRSIDGQQSLEGQVPLEQRIHFPGGTFGIFVTVQKLTGLSARDTVAVVKEALGQDTWIHTDDHNLQGVGCAYAKALMADNAQEVFGTNPIMAKEIWSLLTADPQTTTAVYTDKHLERQGIVVDSLDFTVLSPNGEEQSFVYDGLRTKNWVGQMFAPRVNQLLEERGLPQYIDSRELWKELDNHATQAFNLLVIDRGLPLIQLDNKTVANAAGRRLSSKH